MRSQTEFWAELRCDDGGRGRRGGGDGLMVRGKMLVLGATGDGRGEILGEA